MSKCDLLPEYRVVDVLPEIVDVLGILIIGVIPPVLLNLNHCMIHLSTDDIHNCYPLQQRVGGGGPEAKNFDLSFGNMIST